MTDQATRELRAWNQQMALRIQASPPSAVRMRADVWLWLWAVYLVAQPFYVFSKGLPQPADALALAIFFSIFLRDGVVAPARLGMSRSLVAFVGWVLLVSGFWIIALTLSRHSAGDGLRTWHYPLFHVFNCVFFVGLIGLYRRYGPRALTWTFWGTMISLGVQVAAGLAIGANPHQRSTLFFENPNQLGYYALLSATLVVLCGRFSKAPLVAIVAGLLAAAFLNSLALSKGAGIGVVMLIALLLLRRPLVVVVMGAALYAALHLGILETLTERISWRFDGFGVDSDDSLGGRGYDRILLFPQYIILGAGEGATSRFGLAMEGELHSTVGTLLFSYGIVGLVLFLRFLQKVVRGVPRFEMFALMPVALYGITHQGLRFRPFWVVLAVVAWIGLTEARRRQALRGMHFASAQTASQRPSSAFQAWRRSRIRSRQ